MHGLEALRNLLGTSLHGLLISVTSGKTVEFTTKVLIIFPYFQQFDRRFLFLLLPYQFSSTTVEQLRYDNIAT